MHPKVLFLSGIIMALLGALVFGILYYFTRSHWFLQSAFFTALSGFLLSVAGYLKGRGN